MKFLKKYSFLIGIILFVFILSKLDFGYYKQLLSNIDFIDFSLALLLLVPMLFIRSFRWQFLMKKQNIRYSFWDVFLMYQASIYIGMFTPGRLGEASRVLYLTKKGYSAGRAFVGVVWDRLSDIILLVFLGYISMFFFFRLFEKEIFILGAVLLFVLLGVIFILKNQLAKVFFKKIFSFFIPKKYKNSWDINFQEFVSDTRLYKLKDIFWIFFLTFLAWIFYFLMMFLLARGIGINEISFLYISAAVILATFITFLPVSIAGLGTRDVALLALFSLFPVSKELTIAFSMSIFLVSVSAAFIGLLCWIKKPLVQ